MKEIVNEINRLASEELSRANEKFEPFRSAHEGYAVILEEIDEAKAEMADVNLHKAILWELIKTNVSTADEIEALRFRATRLAAETIQIIAMCDKFSCMESGGVK